MKNEKITDLKEMLSKSVEKYANRTLYKLGNKEITYREMQEKVNCLGTSLIQKGLKNKRIAIISENRYEWEIAYFAITNGTGIAVPLDKSLVPKEITTILKRAKVEAIFCSEKYENILMNIQQEIEGLKYIICFEEKKTMSFNRLIEEGTKLIEAGNKEFIDAKIDNESIGFIMFTSGTTEKSKAVMLSHKNVCVSLVNVAQVFPISCNDIALSVLPLNHVLEGLFCLLLTIYRGATRIYCHDLKDIVEDINKYNVSFMGAVPAVYEYMLKRIDEINKKNINIFMSGGASLEEEIEQSFKEKGINLVQGYGITETAPVVCMSNIELHKMDSVGKVVPNIELKLANKDENGIGEILVKGENVFLGYYQDEEATKQVLKDGWFYTGDLGRIDEDGYLFLHGRIKNMIVLPNGKKVFPEEVETIINKIDGVKESLVFDKKIGENKVCICAEIVCENLEQKQEILEQIRKINEDFSSYKKINIIYATNEELLKTPTGKIKRKEEIEKIRLHSYKQTSSLKDVIDNDITKSVKEILSKQLGIDAQQISEETSIYDLGADSLDKVEIILAIEKEFNIKVPKEISVNLNKVKDICLYLIPKYNKNQHRTNI